MPNEFTETMTLFKPAAVFRAAVPADSHDAAGGVETLKFSAIGLGAASIGLELINMLTGIVTGLFGSGAPVVALVAAIVMVPVQVVPEGMLPGVTVTGKEVSL